MGQRQAVLEGWLRFNDDDVACNRDGRQSTRQRRLLLWSAAWRLVLGPAIAVIAALIAALWLDTGLAALLALGALMIGLQLTWTGFACMVDVTSSAVAFVTAPLIRAVVRGRYTSYNAIIGPVRKTISAKAYLGLEPAVGAEYHLFYAPGCRSLLSMEASSATEPLPAHPFGPDSAHAWDRLRWSWILITVGVFGALLGAHLVAAAHPAHPVAVAGTVQDYVETTTTGRGAHTDRSIYLVGDGTVYVPEAESDYSPPAPDFYGLIGTRVVLYVNDGTADVLALNDGESTYAADWFRRPEHETQYLLTNAILTTAIGAAILGLGIWLLLRDRRRAEAMPGRPVAYAPPTVHPIGALWGGAVAMLVVLGFIGLAMASAK